MFAGIGSEFQLEAEMEIQDRRVKRTQNLLAKALIALTLEKGYEAVTIRDVTERADIGYATFFRHYRDKDALLLDVLDVVLDELMALLRPSAPGADPALDGTLIFRYVGAHSEVCRVLLGSRGSAELARRMRAAGTRGVLKDNHPLPGSLVPMEVAAHHLVASTIALISWWLEQNMPFPPTDADPALDGTLIFRYVGAHSEVCRVLLGSRGSAELARRMRAAGTRGVLKDNHPLPGSLVPMEVAAHHLVASTIALISWWLEQNMPYPPARMGIIYSELIVRPTSAVAFVPPAGPRE